jgi:hypothetical protein
MSEPTYEVDGQWARLSTEDDDEWLRSDSVVHLEDWA